MTLALIFSTLAFAAKTPCERLLTHAESGHPVRWSERALPVTTTGEASELGPLLVGMRGSPPEQATTTLTDLLTGTSRKTTGSTLSSDPTSASPLLVAMENGTALRAFFRRDLTLMGDFKARSLGLREFNSASMSADGTTLAASDTLGHMVVVDLRPRTLEPHRVKTEGRILGHVGNDALFVTPEGGIGLAASDGLQASTIRGFGALFDARDFTHLLSAHDAKRRAILVATRRLVLVDFGKDGLTTMQELPEMILDARFDTTGDFLAFTGTSASPLSPQIRSAGVVDLRGSRPKVIQHFLLHSTPTRGVQSALTTVGEQKWALAFFDPSTSSETLYSLSANERVEIQTVSDSAPRAQDSTQLAIREHELYIAFQAQGGRWMTRALGAASGAAAPARVVRIQANASNPFRRLVWTGLAERVQEPAFGSLERHEAFGFNPSGPGPRINRESRLSAAGVPIEHVADDAVKLSDGSIAVRVGTRLWIGHKDREEVEMPEIRNGPSWMFAGPKHQGMETLFTLSRYPIRDPSDFILQWFNSAGALLASAQIKVPLISPQEGYVPTWDGRFVIIPFVGPAGFIECEVLEALAP